MVYPTLQYIAPKAVSRIQCELVQEHQRRSYPRKIGQVSSSGLDQHERLADLAHVAFLIFFDTARVSFAHVTPLLQGFPYVDSAYI
jgi:hypothetical protein